MLYTGFRAGHEPDIVWFPWLDPEDFICIGTVTSIDDKATRSTLNEPIFVSRSREDSLKRFQILKKSVKVYNLWQEFHFIDQFQCVIENEGIYN